MSIEQALIAEVRALTQQQQQEVLNFATFLRSHRSSIATHPPVPGLHKNVPYRMAGDFDAPLPDSFWLGENKATA